MVLAMVVAVITVSGLAYWQERQESVAALADFGREQAVLAHSMALAIAAEASSQPADNTSLLKAAADIVDKVQSPRTLVVLLRAPGDTQFTDVQGQTFTLPSLQNAVMHGHSDTQVPGGEAEVVHLPHRMAMAGLARVESRLETPWIVVTIATAAPARDRERRSRVRLLTSIATAVGLVILFGGLAFGAQRKELQLERELALSAVRRQGDERLERLGRAATLGTLAMGVAHEIATPLGVIALRADQLVDVCEGNQKAERACAAIQEQAARIDQVVRGLLNLARGGAPVSEPVLPEEILREATNLCEHRFAIAGVTVRLAPLGELPRVSADRRLLVQAVVNLLLNACDASHPGGSVVVSASVQDDHLLLKVSDEGDGISAALANRAHEPFLTTKRDGAGTGLGLAISSEIVKSHRGTLSLSPLEPHGTCAVIRLPIEEAHTRSA